MAERLQDLRQRYTISAYGIYWPWPVSRTGECLHQQKVKPAQYALLKPPVHVTLDLDFWSSYL